MPLRPITPGYLYQIGPDREFFLLDDVQDAYNPDFRWGYCHRPIEDPNPGWRPQTWRDLEDPTEPILVAHIKEDIRKGLGPPNPMLPWSKVNTLVCPVIVERGQQCGITFKDNGMMNRHFHEQHTGCFLPPDTAAITSKERADSHKILARYMVSTDWRNAHFLAEPGRSPIGSDIGQFAGSSGIHQTLDGLIKKAQVISDRVL
ncbi:hypothetical protein N7495_003453 [Penicillium taxi]|uniref:uncharacterized protein n=1 Tax=Penicillium taxi TaxID=168475 RepID=UPI0025457A2E|nr:uncharacterized protein N7495_003453 [Penicillium taxi]KAJ5902925.1 hypothetical protein N7495_003453 [Penicillium taxi]